MGTDRHDTIRERAYRLWEEEGRQHGRALDYWTRAEREMASMDEALQQAVESVASKPPRARKPRTAAAAAAPAPAEAPKRKRAVKKPDLHA